MRKKYLLLTGCLAILAILSIGCIKEYSASRAGPAPVDSINLTLRFTPVVDSLKLRFNTPYKNYWNENYMVSAFKFYISNIDLINTDAGLIYHVNADIYSLVDAADSATWAIQLVAIPFTYNRISFLIGVDSIRNVSGAQTGALDPAHGMFWTWNSGYIMAKLEGSSSLSSEVNNKIEYHIGGFAGDSRVLRKPVLSFPFGQNLQINAGSKSVITVEANVNAWFHNPNQIKIAATPACTTPGLMAKNISENYAGMFTVIAVINN